MKYKCPICNSEGLNRLFTARNYTAGDNFFIYKCRKCGIVLTEPRPASADFKKHYGESYYGKRTSFAEKLVNYLKLRRVLNLIRAKSGISVLDAGCGNASFISAMAKRNFEISGTEIAPETHFVDEKIIPKICRKDLKDCGFPDKSFDIITMWHLLEHLGNPQDYLSEARRILKNEGILIIEIPNFDSLQSKFSKSNWFHLDVPRHLFHFTPETISGLLKLNGFKILGISHFSAIYSIFGFIQSVINIFTKRKNLLFDLLNGKIMRTTGIRRDLIITLLLIIPVAIMAVPAALLEASFKKGGVITISTKK